MNKNLEMECKNKAFFSKKLSKIGFTDVVND